MSLNAEQIISIFKKTGALLEGHFLLTSGLHSDKYFQCAKVFQYPHHAETLCTDIAAHFKNSQIELVIAPAVGGIIVGQEIARLLGVRSVFTERVDGKMTLRRGFEISEGEQVLVAEDVTTTGGSVKEVIDVVRANSASVVSVTAIVDRSGGTIHFNCPYFSLLQMEVNNYKPNQCPLCKSGTIPVKPGSRDLRDKT